MCRCIKKIFISLLFLAPMVKAADVQFNITGIISNSACTVTFGNNQTVKLGTYSTRYLDSVGKSTPLIPFSIIVSDCPQNYQNVQVLFEGDTASGNSELVALHPGGAENVGIALYDSDKVSIIPLNNLSSGKEVSTTQETVLQFYAAYQSTGVVSEGDANADVNFTISYN